jgi:FkbM family methyltransferase
VADLVRPLKWLAKQVLPGRVVNRIRLEKHLRGHPDEVAMLASLCWGRPPGVMIDVGAHKGSCADFFLGQDWKVIAYEPDPKNRAAFITRWGGHANVTLSTCAVSNKEETGVPLFASEVSSGISGLSAFHASHVPTSTVDTVRLDLDLKRRNVGRVDFLKIDIEGFDFFALQGFDWSLRPGFVLYEFENRKTTPLGYSLEDSAGYMKNLGYTLLYSIWEPVVEYGQQHTWRGLSKRPPDDVATCWGNVLCFEAEADLGTFLARFSRSRLA